MYRIYVVGIDKENKEHMISTRDLQIQVKQHRNKRSGRMPICLWVDSARYTNFRR